MGRRDDDAAAGEMVAHQSVERDLCRRIETGGGLIQQPDRPRDGGKPRERQSPPLSGRKVSRGKIRQRLKTERRERGFGRAFAAEIIDPEAQILGDRQRGFQRVLMREIMRLLADAAFRLAVNRALAGLYRSGGFVPIYERWFGGFGKPSEAIQAMYLLNGLPE